jgi:FixJ family two-component response regulator
MCRIGTQRSKAGRSTSASKADRTRDRSLRPRRDRLNKQIASQLGIVEKTVKVHRARAMEKMRAGSVAELVRLPDRVGVIASMPSLEREGTCWTKVQ